MPLSKKIFISSFSVFILLLLFWGVYFFAFKEDAKQQKSPLVQSDSTEIEVIQKKPKLLAISEETVLSPTLIKDQSAIKYYSKENGLVYRVEFDGSRKIALTEKELPGLRGVSWSPDQNKVITNKNGLFFFYDYDERANHPLKDNLDTVVWQSNEKILYKYYNASTGKRSLNIANPDGSSWNELTSLDFKNTSIRPIPMTGLISFWNQGNGFEETSLRTIPALGGEEKTVFSGKFGADYLWSPDGSQLLISHVTERSSSNIQLAFTNAKGGEYKNLNVSTFVSKCVWSKNENSVFYALPGMIPSSVVLPNDYIAHKFETADTFWKIDLDTGKTTRLVELDDLSKVPPVDAVDLFLTEDESFLFFTNRTDGKLYRLAL